MENKVIFRAGGEGASIQFCPKMKLTQIQSESGQDMNVLHVKKAIFRSGEAVAVTKQSQKDAKRAVVQEISNYVTPQNISRGDLAWKISDDILRLSKMVQELSKLNAQYSDIFKSMDTELAIVSASMRKIAQNISRSNKHNFELSPMRFSTFCNGLSETLRLQNHVLTDLRHLQFMAENFSTQIVVIYLTIHSQNETTQTIFETEC